MISLVQEFFFLATIYITKGYQYVIPLTLKQEMRGGRAAGMRSQGMKSKSGGFSGGPASGEMP